MSATVTGVTLAAFALIKRWNINILLLVQVSKGLYTMMKRKRAYMMQTTQRERRRLKWALSRKRQLTQGINSDIP